MWLGLHSPLPWGTQMMFRVMSTEAMDFKSCNVKEILNRTYRVTGMWFSGHAIVRIVFFYDSFAHVVLVSLILRIIGFLQLSCGVVTVGSESHDTVIYCETGMVLPSGPYRTSTNSVRAFKTSICVPK